MLHFMQAFAIRAAFGEKLCRRDALTNDAPPERILVDLENVLAELESERGRIGQAISALEDLAGSPGPRHGRPPKSRAIPTITSRRRRMSASARKRISEAMKQRWAKWKGKPAPKKG